MSSRTPRRLPLLGLLSVVCWACTSETSDDGAVDTDPPAEDTDTQPPCADEEVPYNGLDDDCDPSTADDDLDDDGAVLADDCDDADPTRGPNAEDVGWDGVDQDCDGADLPATPAQPSLSVDLGLPGDLVFTTLGMTEDHALVIGRVAAPEAGAGLVGAVVSLATGAVTPVALDAPDTTHVTRNLVVWARGDGFGVMVVHEDWGEGGACHLYATPVGADGVAGTRRRLTDPASSQAYCDGGVLALAQGGVDHVFHLQPQRFRLDDGAGNLQVLRRVVDVDDGAELDVDDYGVFQGGESRLLGVTPLGDHTVLTYAYSASPDAKLTVFDADGLVDNDFGDRIYGGHLRALGAPLAPVHVTTDGRADATTGSRTLALLRTLDGATPGTSTLEWAQVELTPGTPWELTHVEGGPDSRVLLGEDVSVDGTAVVVSDLDGTYRAVWARDGALVGTTTSAAAAVVGDDRLAGEAVSLVTASEAGRRAAFLLREGEDDAATLRLVLSRR